MRQEIKCNVRVPPIVASSRSGLSFPFRAYTSFGTYWTLRRMITCLRRFFCDGKFLRVAYARSCDFNETRFVYWLEYRAFQALKEGRLTLCTRSQLEIRLKGLVVWFIIHVKRLGFHNNHDRLAQVIDHRPLIHNIHRLTS